MMPSIVPIVEGKGEVEAVPLLLRRIAADVGGWVEVERPILVQSGKFLNKSDEFNRYIGLALNKASHCRGHVLLIMDCDQDVGDKRRACPAELGPRLLSDIRAIRSDIPSFVALAHKEYENWFLAALNSLRGHHGIPIDACVPANPEGPRDAKGVLGRLLGRHYGYDDLLQTKFTSLISLNEARTSPSFSRLYEWVKRIIEYDQ